LSLGIPVQGVSTFEVMVKSCRPQGASLVVLESKRADFYTQAFEADFNPAGEPQCLLATDIPTDRIVCGDGIARLRAETGLAFENAIERTLLDPVVLGKAGLAQFLSSGQKARKPEPFYMRGADVSVSTKVQRQINDYPAQ
jgi:tRNA A37 threonylcarbamoyladenosine modification protein TsaB